MSKPDADAAKGQQLHERLLQGDPLTPSQLLQEYLFIISTHLKMNHPSVDPDLISDAATEACLNYLERPLTFDPTRRTLLGYLKMSASRDLENALQKQWRRQKRLVSLEIVELSQIAGNSNVEEEVINRQEALDRLKSWQNQQQHLNEQIADTSQDRKLLALLQAGVRKTEAYAAVLGIQHLPLAEQRHIVKQHKDRLTKRLQRLRRPVTNRKPDNTAQDEFYE